ncbi:MAG TPA: hypothetical protein VGP50_10340 [Stellaceae bacterium]|jgi:hypothetical protein|nr:hypothetical protein [Stellaceae bacterium]
MAGDKVLFVNDLVLISEKEPEGDIRSITYKIEVDTKPARQVMMLTPDVAQALLLGLEHVLKGDE